MPFEHLKQLYGRLLADARSRQVDPPPLNREEIRANVDWILYRAVLHRHVEVVRRLYELGITAVSGARPGLTQARTAIHRAASQGQWDMVRALFKIFDRRNYREPRTNLTHLHVACIVTCSERVWQYVDQANLDLDAPCEGYVEAYPLNLAVHYFLKTVEERERAVQEAAREGRDPPAEDNTVEARDTVRLLLRAGADTNLLNRDGSSLLTRAIQASNVQLVTLLIENRAEFNQMDPRTGLLPLNEAIGLLDPQAVEHIVANPRDVNHLLVQERRDLVPVVHRYADHAQERLSLETYQALVGCDEDSLPRLLEQLLATEDRRDFYAKMLSFGADPNALCATGRLPRLDNPAAWDIVAVLLNCRATPTDFDPDGRTPLRRTITYNYFTLMELLLTWDGLVNQLSGDGVSPLEEAVRCLDTDMVNMLVDRRASPNVLNADMKGRETLTAAVKANKVELIKLLIDHGYVPSSIDHVGRSMIDEAIIYGKLDVLSMLLQAGHWPRFDVGDDSRHPLVMAVRHQYTEIARALLLGRADCDPRILNKAELRGLLTRLVANDKLELLDLLLRAGTSPDALDQQQATLLHRAVELKKPEAIRLLLRCQANPNLRSAQMERTPLLQAVVDGDVTIVRRLLEEARAMGIQVKKKTRDAGKMIAIERAVENFDLPMLQLLLDYNVDVRTFNSLNNRELLMRLIARDQPEILRTLIRAGVNPNLQNLRTTTLQQEAVAKSKPEILEWLVTEGGADPSLPNQIGVTPLQLACQTNQTELGMILLRHGADTGPMVRNDNAFDRIVLEELVKDDNLALTEALLKEGVNPNEPTPLLHVAMRYGDREDMVEMLLLNGADPSRPDNMTRMLPREHAVMFNRPKCIALLDRFLQPQNPADEDVPM